MILSPPSRSDLTQRQLKRLTPLLPAEKPKIGGSSKDYRYVVDFTNRSAVVRLSKTLSNERASLRGNRISAGEASLRNQFTASVTCLSVVSIV